MTFEMPPAASLDRTLTTERLTIRAGTMSDAAATWAYRRLPEVDEWLTGAPATVDEYRVQFTDPARLSHTVIVELRPHLGGGIIGDFMMRIEDAWAQLGVTTDAKAQQAELGWVLDPVHSGRGYATEAVRALVHHCFQELRIHRIVANCFLANESSWRLMERVGMCRELHAVQDSLHRSGRWLDSVGYAILREEWDAAR